MNNYAKTYENIINNTKRNIRVETNNQHEICNLFCTFSLSDWEEKDFIQGLNMTGKQNMLYINPNYDYEDGEKVERTKDYKLNYNFKIEGYSRNFVLEYIFIRAPSKIVINRRRYEMEICLVFSNKTSYVVVCNPVSVSPNDNEPDDINEKSIWKLFMSISENFPEKNKNVVIKNISYNPLVFFPLRGRNNRNFMTWNDKDEESVTYIQFFNQTTKCPSSFYKKFVKNLVGDMDLMQNQIDSPPEKRSDNLKIFINNSPSVNDKYERIIYKKIEQPTIQSLVKQTQIQENDIQENDIEKSNLQIWVIILIILIPLILLILFIIYLVLFRKNSSVRNTGV
jgi:hypothetical protein